MSNFNSTGMPNALAAQSDGLSRTTLELIERRARLLGPAYRLFYQEPLHAVRGDGVWLFDEAGNRYLDAYNNVVSLGHCHPRVVEAIHRQSALLNTHTRYLHETILDYAERLLTTFPTSLNRVMFTCTGSEANDLALRVAQACTGGTGLIVTEHAYHGVTQAITQISPALRSGDPLPSHVWTVPAPGHFSDDPDPGASFAGAVANAVAEMTDRGVRLAAMFCDTLFSSDGLFPGPPGFLRPAAEVVQAAGGLFVADEVQAGFGRTGDAMWGFARHDVQPDIVTLGKPMANGYPVGAVVMKSACADEFGRKARYFNTFGGNPVAMAAAMATLDAIQEEGLIDQARDVGSFMLEAFEKLHRGHSTIGGVRGAGCFLAIDLVHDGRPDALAAGHIVNDLRRNGLLISATGPGANVLKIRPPLILKHREAEKIISMIEVALHNIEAKM